MSEIVAMFFDGSFEGSITEKMLNYSYDFPTAKLEDYVITVIATPYKEFVGFVSGYLCPKKIDDSSQIPQTSSYELSTFGVCKMLNAIKDPGVSVLEFGRLLYPSDKKNISYEDIDNVSLQRIKDFIKESGLHVHSSENSFACLDGNYRNKGAIVKIAENQLKGAEFHGLVYELDGKWFLTCLGRIYPTLDKEMQHALSARTLLRKPFFWKVVSEAVNKDVDITPFVKLVCNGTTVGRRLSSSQHCFDIILDQCRIEGVSINTIGYRTEAGERKKWKITASTKKSNMYVTHVPVYSISAACGAFNHDDSAEIEGWLNISSFGINANKDYFIVHAEGNSMEPKILDGDLCIFEYTNAIEEGATMLVESNNIGCQHVIKVVRQTNESIELHSINPEYSYFSLTEEDCPRIVGKLIKVLGQYQE